MLFSAAATAQQRAKVIPAEGYWVIEKNIKSPRNCTVHFYSSDHQLIHRQTYTKKMKAHRPRIVKQLNSVLAESITAWRQKNSDWTRK
jgi:hypothetical protein